MLDKKQNADNSSIALAGDNNKAHIKVTNINNFFNPEPSGHPNPLPIQPKNRVIEIIATIIDDVIDVEHAGSSEDLPVGVEFQDKLDYNQVSKYHASFIDLASQLGQVESVLNSKEENDPRITTKFLKNINASYLRQKRNFEQQQILQNSDQIIHNLLEEFKIKFYENKSNHDCDENDVNESILLVICYGFQECKILEKPL